MVPPSPTRRRVLSGCGIAAGVALAGCSVFGGLRYDIHSRPEDGSDIVDLFDWRPASNAFHYDRAAVKSLADRLRESGQVESMEIPLVEERGTGEAGYVPSYTRQGDTYSRVRVDSMPVTLNRWTVWMEPLEELPEDVEFVTNPTSGLSTLDAEIVDRTSRAAVSSLLADRDHSAQRAYRRGVVFFDPLDPAASEFVPVPPFEYAVIEPEGHFGPEELALRVHVAEELVESTRYVHELEPAADSRNDLVNHLRTEHIAVEYVDADVSSDVREVLMGATDLSGYDEEAPISQAYNTFLADLGLADVSLPDGRDVASWRRYYGYDDRYYSTSLLLSDNSLIDIE